MRSVEQPASHTVLAHSRRLIYLAALVYLIWLLYMVQVIAALFASHPSPLLLIASLAGATVFVALYARIAWRNAQRLVDPTPVPLAPVGLALWWPILVMLALSIVLTSANGVSWGALFIYTCAAAAGRLPVRQALALVVGVMLITVLYSWRLGLSPDKTVGNVLTIFFASVTTITMVWSVATSRQHREERAEMARVNAVSAERLRIARDLHDLLGHNLSVIALKSELARRLVDVAPERAAAEIGDIENVARQALDEVREAVAGYRHPSLAGELAGAREVLAAAGITYHFDRDDGASYRLPSAIDAALAWTVREGITNVIRHSHARSCVISLTQQAGDVRIEIADDGPKASSPYLERAQGGVSAGNGLRGLGERIEALDGHYEAGPRASGGFHLHVEIPLKEAGHTSKPPDASPSPAIPLTSTAAARD